jgi:hypothetical protein
VLIPPFARSRAARLLQAPRRRAYIYESDLCVAPVSMPVSLLVTTL